MGHFIGAIRYQIQKIKQKSHYQEELAQMEQRKDGIIPPQFERLQTLQNSCQGKRCFIVADGSSVSAEIGKRLEQELVFGVNSGTQLKWNGWKPKWLGIQDPQAYQALEHEILSGYDMVFAGDNLAGRFHLPEQVVQYPYLGVYKYYFNRYQEYGAKFSGNALEVVYDGYTVIYSMLQIAIYLGIQEIYLIGCQPQNERMTVAYRAAAQYAQEHHIQICTCTPREQIHVFPYCPLTDLLQ